MLIRYINIAFISAVTVKRGVLRSASDKDFTITLDTDTGIVELIDKGNEQRFEQYKGSVAHVPVSNVAFALDPAKGKKTK